MTRLLDGRSALVCDAARPAPIPRLGGGKTLLAMYQGGRGCRRTRAERRADRPYRPAPDSVLRRASGPARQPRVRRQPNAPVHHKKDLIPRSGERLHLPPKPPFDLNLDLAWRRSPSVLVTPTNQGPPLFYALTLPAPHPLIVLCPTCQLGTPWGAAPHPANAGALDPRPRALDRIRERRMIRQPCHRSSTRGRGVVLRTRRSQVLSGLAPAPTSWRRRTGYGLQAGSRPSHGCGAGRWGQ